MSNSNFYLHVEMMPAALPLSVTAVYFVEPPPYVSIYDTQANFSLIDQLYDEGKILFEHDWVTPRMVNKMGYRTACRHVVDRVLPKLSLKAKVLPTEVLAPHGTPMSFYYPSAYIKNHKVKENNIAKLIGLSLKKGEVKDIWQPLHPVYGWKRNLGRLDKTHTLACLEHGITLTHHYIEGLKQIPFQWVRLIKQREKECLWGSDYSRQAPFWWQRLFESKDFFIFMTPEERSRATHTVETALPHPIYSFYKPLKFDGSDSDEI
jgi:hypothetical protein